MSPNNPPNLDVRVQVCERIVWFRGVDEFGAMALKAAFAALAANKGQPISPLATSVWRGLTDVTDTVSDKI